MNEIKDSEQLMTVNEVCEYLKVNMETLRSWRKKGLIKALRLGSGGTIRFRKSDVMKLMKEE